MVRGDVEYSIDDLAQGEDASSLPQISTLTRLNGIFDPEWGECIGGATDAFCARKRLTFSPCCETLGGMRKHDHDH
ncbi:hypothetical protein CEE69_30740 [Rhodopirellula bahusiensis]|uniref:Uncharacterized protein n=1 Tax=Rhodopirellula bahusiensis TaxID=2014065 RepID=A0A2G1VXM6_9BACT|nr:hypothetical protein CEE69_30740 [Rhodopirellula bahusiensis]